MLHNVLINVVNYDRYDMSIMNIKLFIKDIMNLLNETRASNTLRISVKGFNQLFSSSNYIHGIIDNINNILYIDIITNKDIDSETYVKLIILTTDGIITTIIIMSNKQTLNFIFTALTQFTITAQYISISYSIFLVVLI